MLKILPVREHVVNCHLCQFLLKNAGELLVKSW